MREYQRHQLGQEQIRQREKKMWFPPSKNVASIIATVVEVVVITRYEGSLSFRHGQALCSLPKSGRIQKAVQAQYMAECIIMSREPEPPIKHKRYLIIVS
jgi:hypothetical protein